MLSLNFITNVKKIVYFFVGCSFILFPRLYAGNTNYVSNKVPLSEVPYEALPLGSVKADGWLLTQLQLQKAGLTGNAETIYSTGSELGASCDWLGGSGDSWERAPYYVKGLVALAYTLDDTDLKSKVTKWIDWSVDNQKTNGYFGPANNNDWWARMPMLYAIRDYYEATGDDRIINFFTKYFQYEYSMLDAQPLSSWGQSRAGDNIEIVFWLYNHTGDTFLLDLADKLKTQAYDWTDIFTNNKFMAYGDDYQPKHNVNVPQALKMPAIYYQRSKSESDSMAYRKGYEHLMCDHGQPEGMESGNEMINGRSAMTGLEMCSIVEQMQTCETAQMILGDVSIGDQLEKVAFNAYPGGVSKDFKGLQYYTQANQVKSSYGNHNFAQEYNNGLMPGPFSGYQCCRFNLHMGWSYFVKSMWAATSDNGIAAMAYGPCHVTALVASGKEVTIQEETNYPFSEDLSFTLTLNDEETTFPIKFRIPAWCENPQVSVNGENQEGVVSGQFFSMNRAWKSGDKIELQFPMNIVLNEEVNNSVSVQRGPLVYSMEIGEKWNVHTDYGNGFKEYEVLPTTSWNYGFEIDRNNPASSFEVVQTEMPENPFIQSTTPVSLKVKARKLNDWGYALNGLFATDPPYSPVSSTQSEVELTLVPFGAENLRLTCLPVLGTSEMNSQFFEENFDDGDQKGWVNYSGNFMVDNGEYLATNTVGFLGSKSVETSTQFTDFTYDVNVMVGNAGDGGIMFRTSKLSLGADEYMGYYAGISASSGSVILGKANGSWTQLKSASASISSNTWYKMRVTAEGSNIKVYVDDMETPKISYIDASYSSGYIGVRCYNAITRWDNISVKSSDYASVSEIKLNDKIHFYPNPVKNYLEVTFDEQNSKDFIVSVLDMKGSTLKLAVKSDSGGSVIRLDTTGLQTGVYTLKLESGNQILQSKFIKS